MTTKTFGKRSGFTLPEIVIVVVVIGLLSAIAIPNFVRARQTSQKNHCIKHLQQIDAAKAAFARLNQQQTTNEQVALCKFIYDPKNFVGTELICPAGGMYTLDPVGVPPTCSIPGHYLPRKPQ